MQTKLLSQLPPLFSSLRVSWRRRNMTVAVPNARERQAIVSFLKGAR